MDNSAVCKNLADLMLAHDPDGLRAARAFREAFDYAYNGAKTGRYRPDQLSKTESAHIGSLVEINLRREFDEIISDGQQMDYSINGYDVDCKYSKSPFGWSIPPETHHNYAMVCHASDLKSTWRLGFIYIDPSYLNTGKNRDGKTTLRSSSRSFITWAWYDHPLPENTLLHLDPSSVDRILTQRSGQKRINELFRLAQRKVIPRGVIETVAQQKDPLKRVRGNGGARTDLQPEGIIVLGDYRHHRAIAQALGLPTPILGSFISARVVPARDTVEPRALIAGSWWRLAAEEDPVIPAPDTTLADFESLVEKEIDMS